MATKKVLKRPFGTRLNRNIAPPRISPITYNNHGSINIGPAPTRPPRVKKPPAVITEPTELHRDIVGRPLQVGQYVLAVDNNRIMVCRIHHLTARRVAIIPALEHKRSFASPKKKIYNKECFNVAIIPEEEWFMYKLFGET